MTIDVRHNAKTVFDVPKGTPVVATVTTPYWAKHGTQKAKRVEAELVETAAPLSSYFASFTPTF